MAKGVDIVKALVMQRRKSGLQEATGSPGTMNPPMERNRFLGTRIFHKG